MQQHFDGGAGDVTLVLNTLQASAGDEDPETDPDALPTPDELHSTIPVQAAQAPTAAAQAPVVRTPGRKQILVT